MRKQLPDAALIRAIRERSRMGAETLYDHYAQTLFKVICCSTDDPVTAELILEETILTVWNNIEDFEPANSSLLLWMAGIARALAKKTVPATDKYSYGDQSNERFWLKSRQ